MSSPLSPSPEPPRDPIEERFNPSLRRLLVPGLFVLGLLAAVVIRRPSGPEIGTEGNEATAHRVSGPAFGTSYIVAWVGNSEDEVSIQSAVKSVVAAVNASMSTYHPNSELSRFNRIGATTSVTVSEDLGRVLGEAYWVNEQSMGAFDPTVGPLVNVWGFGPPEVIEPPSEATLYKASESVGLAKLKWKPETREIRKTVEGLEVDLSAIAKGYAVDRVSEALLDLGVTRHLVEIGGEVKTSGKGPRGVWTVGIEKPQSEQAQLVFETVDLAGQGMATSGNYRNFVTVDGKRVTHIIDPRSREPVAHGLSSVTVVSDTCMRADGLATALYVLGAKEGLAWANQSGIAALFLTVEGDLVTRQATSAFEDLSRGSK